MAFGIERLYMLVLVIAYVVAGQQLFPGEPACAEACYHGAIATNNCSPTDIACQCSPAGRALVSLLGGTCLLTNCSINDMSSFTTAYSAACASIPPATTSGAGEGPGPGVATAQTSPLQEHQPVGAGAGQDADPTQQQQQQQQRGAAGLSSAAITGVAVAGAAVGVLVGAAVYFLAVRRRRRRRRDRRQWAQMEREKAAMQTSLEELRRAVSRQGTFDTVGSKEQAAPAASSPQPAYGKRNTFVVNSKDGPQELMVPEMTYYELPGSLAHGEKI